MNHKHSEKQSVSMYSKCILKFRECQEKNINGDYKDVMLSPEYYVPMDIHPDLVCDIEIDPLPVVEIPGLEGLTRGEILTVFGGENYD